MQLLINLITVWENTAQAFLIFFTFKFLSVGRISLQNKADVHLKVFFGYFFLPIMKVKKKQQHINNCMNYFSLLDTPLLRPSSLRLSNI